jgi:SEC-C motif-containing protein
MAELPSANRACPCQRGPSYAECCEPIHTGTAAPTAERLMRSRYSAYALGLSDYVLTSWHSSTRPRTIELDPAVRWYRLDILGRTGGGLLDSTGTVEFRAFHRGPDGSGEQHELSSFVKEAGNWFYFGARSDA